MPLSLAQELRPKGKKRIETPVRTKTAVGGADTVLVHFGVPVGEQADLDQVGEETLSLKEVPTDSVFI